MFESLLRHRFQSLSHCLPCQLSGDLQTLSSLDLIPSTSMSLGLPLGLEAPIMTPDGVIFPSTSTLAYHGCSSLAGAEASQVQRYRLGIMPESVCSGV